MTHQYLQDGIMEDLDAEPRITLGTIGGVKVTATRHAWASVAAAGGLGVLRELRSGKPLVARVRSVVAFTLALQITNAIHAGGHIAGGKLVESPMDELVITATRFANLYEGDQSRQPSRVHIGRAIGGPVANLAASALFDLGARKLPDGFCRELCTYLTTFNRAVGLGALLPFPPVDGGVIWREVRKAWK